MSDTPRTDEIWVSMHGSGYQMMLLAQKLERELAEARREKEEAREIHNSNMNRYALRAEQAESRAAALEEALSQMLDDMGVDGLCVCPAAKEQAIAAMGEET